MIHACRILLLVGIQGQKGYDRAASGVGVFSIKKKNCTDGIKEKQRCQTCLHRQVPDPFLQHPGTILRAMWTLDRDRTRSCSVGIPDSCWSEWDFPIAERKCATFISASAFVCSITCVRRFARMCVLCVSVCVCVCVCVCGLVGLCA